MCRPTSPKRCASLGKATDSARHQLFPKLGLSAHAIHDLVLQEALLDAVERAPGALADAAQDLYPVLNVGVPLHGRRVPDNAALLFHRGEVLGVVPKAYLPNCREFYERRHFASGLGERD